MNRIKRLSSADVAFNAALNQLLSFDSAQNITVDKTVADILIDIQKCGDEALLRYTRFFDHLNVISVSELELPSLG